MRDTARRCVCSRRLDAARPARAAANLRDDWSTIWMNSGNPRRALEELDLGWEIMRAARAGRAGRRTNDRRAARSILCAARRLRRAIAELPAREPSSRTRAAIWPISRRVRIGEADDAACRPDSLEQAGLDLDAAAARAAGRPGSRRRVSAGVRYALTRAE